MRACVCVTVCFNVCVGEPVCECGCIGLSQGRNAKQQKKLLTEEKEEEKLKKQIYVDV